MAIGANTVWRCRVNGSDLNSGGFDASIVGAGTDYTEQDVAELALSDLATAGISANVTSAIGGFTSAMIGNAIWLVAGTGWTAGTYFITAVASSNAATLDRNCCTAAASGGEAKLGGAHATLQRHAATGVVNGNTVMVRGQGSDTPVDIDYIPPTYLSAAGVTYVGYNGRPKVGHNGALFHNAVNTKVTGFYFIQLGVTYTIYGAMSSGGNGFMYDCVVDSGGNDATQLSNTTAMNCSFINTGNQGAGTRPCISFASGVSSALINCLVKDQRGAGVSLNTARSYVSNSVIQNCAGDGIQITSASGSYINSLAVDSCTIHGNGGHGVTIDAPMSAVRNTLISGHTGSGKYGLYWSAAPVGYAPGKLMVCSNNFFGNTTDSNYALSDLDTTVDPQYINAPLDLTPTNTALRYLSGVGSL